MRHCIVNLGCKVNRVEADGFERVLAECGSVSGSAGEADLIVVNTCTVTAEADKKARKAVRQALRANENAQVVVTGCASAINADAFEAMGDRVSVVPKAQAGRSLRALALERAVAQPVTSGHAAAHPVRAEAGEGPFESTGSRTRVGIKVQDGCDNACTYCIVHVARGKARSMPADSVASQAIALAERGVREMVLTGINLATYRDQDVDLAALLRRLLRETEAICRPGELPCRFRVSSVEPADVDDGLIDVLASADGRICRHLHLPLQSGSDKVLAEMARPYRAEGFCALAERLRMRVPGIALATDVIVGFPGETEDDFRRTCEVVSACGFMNVHVFPYSRREGTPAAARDDQVSPEVKADRASRLRALAAELRTADLAARRGATELALVEEQGRAMTESYYEVTAPSSASVGALVPIIMG